MAVLKDPELRTWWDGITSRLIKTTKTNIYEPFRNATTFNLMSWYYQNKGALTLSTIDQEAGWINGLVMLRLPAKCPSHKSPESEAQTITIGGIYYRKLTDIICTAFIDSPAHKFHYTPFHLFRKLSPNSEPKRVYMELYNSDAFLKEHEKLQKQTHEPSCKLNWSVAAMMLWSNSTHLASFGNTSLWPIYCYFGNQLKYSHTKLSNYAAHHIVLILDNEFLHSYKHGIVVNCADGNEQHLHPCILTYLADYPEKVLLSTIQYLGQCPCPHCFILKWEIDGISTESDVKQQTNTQTDTPSRQKLIERACREVYNQGQQINSTYVENLLKPTSMVPTHNAFSEHLLDLGFEFHEVFVPNLLHEFKLGVWKAVFMHLL
ncbi:hypothetical protein P691DRAFT_799126 [Macrolepiota fuliginosa MF-IS2]|uniref:Uncharacterized protein n=1 Tax=Macrolepiota fuliginosa MF-IS2 TaxID=1400762 RepID=A0A9P6BWC2_9AGAR|nr:hypothetical protein P691DRAFT_799126 [Macrolepiota fuliginosa MF-IS2]